MSIELKKNIWINFLNKESAEIKEPTQRKRNAKNFSKHFKNVVEPGGSNFEYITVSSGVRITENGKIKKAPITNRNAQTHSNFQFGATHTNFNSTIQSSNNSMERVHAGAGLNPHHIGSIPPTDRHHLTVTGDYDTYMMSSNISFKDGSRNVSQGRINLEKKNYDVKELLLPKISEETKKRMNKSISNQFLMFDKTLGFTNKDNQSIFVDEGHKKLDQLNTDIMLNPSWGQTTKAKGLEAQKIGNRPKRRQSVEIISMKQNQTLGVKKKKEAYLSRLKLQKNDQIPSLSYRTIF